MTIESSILLHSPVLAGFITGAVLVALVDGLPLAYSESLGLGVRQSETGHHTWVSNRQLV